MTFKKFYHHFLLMKNIKVERLVDIKVGLENLERMRKNLLKIHIETEAAREIKRDLFAHQQS